MIATLGEALVDLIEQPDGYFRACLGGSVFNFTLGLASQGVSTIYLNPLSGDRFGIRFRTLLLENGGRLAQQASSNCPTSLAVVTLDGHGVPSYAFHREGVADRDIDAEKLIAAFPKKLELLHTGGLALVPDDIETVLQALRAGKNRNALISVDANLRPQVVRRPEVYRDAVMRVVRQAHIVKVSDEDLVHLGMQGLALADVANMLFHESSTELIALTYAQEGATLLTRRCMVESPVPAGLHVVDTVGAGDCFHAGLIAYLQRSAQLASSDSLACLEPGTLGQALRHAVSAASINITRAGCAPATWQQTVQFSQTW